MDPAIFSAAFSLLIVGLITGLTLDKICSNYYFESLRSCIERGIADSFEKDKKIDDLKEEIKTIREEYEKLYLATEKIRNLRPPNIMIPKNLESFESDSDSSSELESTD